MEAHFDIQRSGFQGLVSFRIKTARVQHHRYNLPQYLLLHHRQVFHCHRFGLLYKADEFTRIPSQNIHAIIGRVSYPALSSIQYEPAKLKSTYKKLIQNTIYVTAVLMMGLAATARKEYF